MHFFNKSLNTKMAVTNAMFLFEVVVESVKSLVESRHLIIRSDFADIFSLELKDPKQIHIVMPEPPPLPPEPVGKKGKKKKPPKPKKGKKGKVEEPPPEPVIQSGQSVLFTSSAEFLIQNMNKFPLEVSLWSKEDIFVFIGSTRIPWDNVFLKYLENICDCQEPLPVTLNEEYNVFEEGTAKLMAKIGLQVKLTYLTDKVTTSFRTLSEDPTVKKCLYTGINSKTTSYICTMKTTDKDFEENCNKIENNFVIDKTRPNKIIYADYKNAPGANLSLINEGDYCCMGNADKPPQSIYKAPEMCPDIDHIIDYVRKIIVSCNDNMRMLTPRPTISPRYKATDIDKLCYCKESNWPTGKLAERFRKEVQGDPCLVCINVGKKSEDSRGGTFDIANIRGPCGRADCKIAIEMRAYLENLVEEDNKEFNIEDVIGPCGSKSCNLAEKIKEFLRHEGVFSQGSNIEGLSTQCACVNKMQMALTKRNSCSSVCSKDCDDSGSEASPCEGKDCPFNKQPQVYNVYYFTVEHEYDKQNSPTSTPVSGKSSIFKYCSTDCPSMKASDVTSCSKTACTSVTSKNDHERSDNSKCQEPACPNKQHLPPSPADSDIIVHFDDIHNTCCIKSCDVADKVKHFISDGISSNKNKTGQDDDPCYCDCTCNFKFSKKTTYCAVCGGFECLGDEMRDQPVYTKPHPCPVYHKLYDKKYINVPSPFPEEEKSKQQADNMSVKSSKTVASRIAAVDRKLTPSRSIKSIPDRKSEKKETREKITKKVKQEKKKVGKFTANVEEAPLPAVEKKPVIKYPYPPVPKYMGWNWIADDIPGMKPRPKWKPGAANKILVRRYRAMREGIDIIAKKKRAMMQRKKKIEMKPTLVVKKQNGEYTVQMEVFKKYSKERLLFQYPYDEKPPLIYTVGKTEAEKLKVQKQHERRERRETRRKSRLLQSSFRDKCQEICLKAYNQAIGLLPLPNANDPECPCYTEPVKNISPPVDSCSCSEEGTISSSDTDGDEWTIEFTPPAARWDVKAKHPPTLTENESQYSYLDYKVKLFDRYGNPVPRYFKGPDGKQECSDLGGFWGPDHIWMEINKDGYIGPDDRWIPINFIGPDGMFYSAEEGSFTDNSGKLLKIGIDGYVDKDGKWAWYTKRKSPKDGKSNVSGSTTDTKKSSKSAYKQEPTTKNIPKSTPTGISTPQKRKGDNKGMVLPVAATKSGADKINKTVPYSSAKAKNPVVMSVSVNYNRNMIHTDKMKYTDKMKQLDPKKIAKYREIMQGLEMYDDLKEFRAPIKTNRASNTPKKMLSPYSLSGTKNTQPLTTIPSSANKTMTSISEIKE
ncbi:uncharacterized protein LOC131841021 [Achroia grisella]|uniref:uncharacterized protein LOC131841021 n=1 Tax=Achroia grisella TaxID=688607 RepID=UPI0027D332BC|nr:uncharacterized protein LOC131841021 [Achroia grisella]